MNSTENLYIVASEECAEIQQCISKIMRFGEMNHHPDRPNDTNARELLTEYYQLQSVMEMIMDRGVLGRMSESEIEAIKIKKRNKVSDYAQLSKSLGLLNEDVENTYADKNENGIPVNELEGIKYYELCYFYGRKDSGSIYIKTTLDINSYCEEEFLQALVDRNELDASVTDAIVEIEEIDEETYHDATGK